jgi:hypothetical protein
VPDQSGAFAPVYLPGAVLWRRPTDAAPSQAVTDSILAPLSWRPARADTPERPSRAGRPSPSREPGGAPRRGARQAPPILPAEPPADPSAELEKVRALVRGGDGTTACAQAEHLVRRWPLEIEGHLLLGMIHLDAGALDAAIVSLRRATFLDGDNALAHFNLGQAYLRSGDATRARAALTHARRVLAGTPDDEAVLAGGEMAASELRYAVEVQLAGLSTTRASR